MPRVERQTGIKHPPLCPEWASRPGRDDELSPPSTWFRFCFLNNTVCSWNFLFGQYITTAMFLFCFERKGGKCNQCPKGFQMKSESIRENPLWCWKKTTLSPRAGTAVSLASFSHVQFWIWKKDSSREHFQQAKRKIKKRGFLSSSNFKVTLVDDFTSQTQCQFKVHTSVSRHCFPILITRHELATGLGTSVTATKRTLPPKSRIFLDAKETNSKGEMKERDDLERQEEASSFCSSCRAA